MLAASCAALAGIVVTAIFGDETLAPEHRAPKIDWLQANPFGALHVLMRDRVTAGGAEGPALLRKDPVSELLRGRTLVAHL